MNWKLVRALALAAAPFVLVCGGLWAQTADRFIGPEQAWLNALWFYAAGVATAAVWYRYAQGTRDPRYALLDALQHAVASGEMDMAVRTPDAVSEGPVYGSKGGESCPCGQDHDAMIYAPLPDGSALVSHLDGPDQGCGWAARVQGGEPGAKAALRVHVEQGCAVHNTQR